MPGIKQTMHEFKHGNLHSGSKSGPTVTSRKQAIAIGLHDKGKGKSKKPAPPAVRPSLAALDE